MKGAAATPPEKSEKEKGKSPKNDVGHGLMKPWEYLCEEDPDLAKKIADCTMRGVEVEVIPSPYRSDDEK